MMLNSKLIQFVLTIYKETLKPVYVFPPLKEKCWLSATTYVAACSFFSVCLFWLGLA